MTLLAGHQHRARAPRSWNLNSVRCIGAWCAAPLLFANVATAQNCPQLNAAGAPEDRVVLVATTLTPAANQYVAQSDPRVVPIRLMSAQFIDPDHDLKINWDRVQAGLDQLFAPGYNGVICLDWEAEFFDALRAGPTDPNFQKAINKGCNLISYVKEKRPNAKVGFYGMPTAHWNTDFTTLTPLFNAMDVLLPSAYMSDALTFEQNVTKLLNNVELALQLAGSKPVVVFHWPRLAPKGGTGGNSLIERNTFIDYLKKTFTVEVNGKRAAGVAIWDMTMRWHKQGQLRSVDSQYIPDEMDEVTYMTQLQRFYICAAMQAVIPGYSCDQPMPGEELISLAGGPVNPTAGDQPSGPGGPPTPMPVPSGPVIVLDPDPVIPSGGNDDGAASESANGAPKATVATGIDLAPLDPYISGWTFTNFLWTSAKWELVPAANSSAEIEMSDFGYPMPASGQVAQTVIGAGMKSILPPGKWLCLYEGHGDIEFAGDASLVRSEPGKALIRVTPSPNGVTMRLSNISPGDPLRNIRVVPFKAVRGTNSNSDLHPQLVNRLESERPSVLRFAAWEQANGSPLENWDDRITRDHVSQLTERGAAVELMVELCNTLDCDAWFTMPAKATDDYIRGFADFVQRKLEPGRRVYVEHVADMLDPDDPQFAYAVERGSELAPGSSNEIAAAKYHAMRSAQVFDIWRDEFASEPGRVMTVLTVPGDDPAMAQKVLANSGAVHAASMIAVVAGIGDADLMHELSLLANGLTVDTTVTLLRQRRAMRMNSFAAVAELVRQTGRPMAAVSTGAGLLVNAHGLNQQLVKTLRKAEFDPRVISLVEKEVDFWKQAGAALVIVDDRPTGAP